MLHLRHSLLIASLLLSGCIGSDGTDYYVSQAGNDSWSGRLPDPNDAGTDGPFATLERARDAVRESIAGGDMAGRSIRVLLRAGTYPVNSTLELTSEDSGTPDAPVIWTAFDDEEVILTGGQRLYHLAPVAGGPFAARVRPELQDSIVVADLRGEGIDDFGSFSDDEGPGLEVFVDNRRMQRARYPNTGFLKIASVPQSGDSLINEGSFQWQRDGIAVGRHFGRIQIDDKRLAAWAPSPDIWLHGYYVWDWRDGFQPVASVDGKSGTVYPASPHHNYGYSKGQRLYFFNVLEELDQPGEWVLDFENGFLYLWPPGEVEEATVSVSVFDGPAISLSGASNVEIRRLTFTEFRKSAVEIERGEHCRLLGNVIRNVGRSPITIVGGAGHEVRSNDLVDLGGAGIAVEGGDRMTLEPAGHLIHNNRIEHFGQVRKTDVPGIRMTGVGITASHNLLTDSPDAGIFFFGNDMILEYNDIHRVAKESDDVGAMYIGRDYSMRGNIIRYNYLHHLEKPMHVGVMGVYLDDFASRVTVVNNVFYKAGRCVFMGGGRRNHVEGNVFVGCSPSVFLDARGKVRNTEFFDGRITVLEDRLAAVNYQQPPYSERYPELVGLYDDDPAMPKYNRIIGNVSMEGTWLWLYSGLPLSILEMTGNVVAAPVVLQTSPETGVETENFVVFGMDAGDVVEQISGAGNVVVSDPPGRFDNAAGTFTWTGDGPSPVEAIPFGRIGLMADEYRVTVQ